MSQTVCLSSAGFILKPPYKTFHPPRPPPPPANSLSLSI